eukprot:Selendium_serpulae@DN6332_c0_g1_i1.p2
MSKADFCRVHNSEPPTAPAARCAFSKLFRSFLTVASTVFLTHNQPETPLLRGKCHLLLVYTSPAWIWALMKKCTTWDTYLAASLSTVSVLYNFFASALLHNFDWNDAERLVVNKLDHAGIFVMIAGSCIPIPLLLMPAWEMTLCLVLQWGIAVWGIYSIMVGDFSRSERGPRAKIYVAMGLAYGVFFPEFMRVMTKTESAAVLAMGGTYISGAVMYAKRLPNLFPGVFGFHEAFHACCLVSALMTYFINSSIFERVATGNLPVY